MQFNPVNNQDHLFTLLSFAGGVWLDSIYQVPVAIGVCFHGNTSEFLCLNKSVLIFELGHLFSIPEKENMVTLQTEVSWWPCVPAGE